MFFLCVCVNRKGCQFTPRAEHCLYYVVGYSLYIPIFSAIELSWNNCPQNSQESNGKICVLGVIIEAQMSKATFYPNAGTDNSYTMSYLTLGEIQMKQTASSSFTSIKFSQAYDTCRRQMTPSPLPQNGIALQAVFPPSLPNGRQLSVQYKHRIYNGLHNLLF